MKYTVIFSALFASALAAPAVNGHGGGGDSKGDDSTVCESHQSVVCSGNGDGGLITLGNLLNGLLGESCSGGDVYCCSNSDIQV